MANLQPTGIKKMNPFPLKTTQLHIAEDALDTPWLHYIQSLKETQVLFVTDATVAHIHALLIDRLTQAASPTTIYYCSGGENIKAIDALEKLVAWLVAQEAGRDTLLVGIGGGSLLDFVGFVASIYKRGIRCCYIPTTLMAMVDASMGGKTALNFGGIKNLIGSFALPEAIFMTPNFLTSLPEEQIRSGYWEIVKYGLISRDNLWQAIQTFDPLEKNPSWLPLIQQAASLKNEFVKQDLTDRGIRQWLNFGHTLGHGVEAFSLNHSLQHGSVPLPHGEAVAIGMLSALYLSHRRLNTPRSYLYQLRDLMQQYHSPYAISCKHYPEIISYIKQDKKNNASKEAPIALMALEKQGCLKKIYCSEEEIKEALDFYQETFGW